MGWSRPVAPTFSSISATHRQQWSLKRRVHARQIRSVCSRGEGTTDDEYLWLQCGCNRGNKLFALLDKICPALPHNILSCAPIIAQPIKIRTVRKLDGELTGTTMVTYVVQDRSHSFHYLLTDWNTNGRLRLTQTKYSTIHRRQFQVRRKLHIKRWRCTVVFKLWMVHIHHCPNQQIPSPALIRATINNGTWVSALIVLGKFLFHVLISHSPIIVASMVTPSATLATTCILSTVLT